MVVEKGAARLPFLFARPAAAAASSLDILKTFFRISM